MQLAGPRKTPAAVAGPMCRTRLWRTQKAPKMASAAARRTTTKRILDATASWVPVVHVVERELAIGQVGLAGQIRVLYVRNSADSARLQVIHAAG